MMWFLFSSSLSRCARPMSIHLDAVGLPTASSVQVCSGLRAAVPRDAVGDRAIRHPAVEPHATDLGGMVRKTYALPPRLFGCPKKSASYRFDGIAMTTLWPCRVVL
jgi:hypothetical protein